MKLNLHNPRQLAILAAVVLGAGYFILKGRSSSSTTPATPDASSLPVTPDPNLPATDTPTVDSSTLSDIDSQLSTISGLLAAGAFPIVGGDVPPVDTSGGGYTPPPPPGGSSSTPAQTLTKIGATIRTIGRSTTPKHPPPVDKRPAQTVSHVKVPKQSKRAPSLPKASIPASGPSPFSGLSVFKAAVRHPAGNRSGLLK